jgi:serine/threonine protein kinase
MAEAMQYLHRKKITHRDLKSANMLVNLAQIPEIAEAGYLNLKVADVGTSKRLNATSTSSPQTVTGTTALRTPDRSAVNLRRIPGQRNITLSNQMYTAML